MQVVFAKDSYSSLNSYGYSPHSLRQYLQWIRSIVSADPSSRKPFIISITTSSPSVLAVMVDDIQSMRADIGDSSNEYSRIAVELNTSCPNIQDAPPPAYDFPSLLPLLDVLAESFKKDETLTIGLKLPPYVYGTQFEEVIKGISSFSSPSTRNPFAFFTCTNTLGTSLLFDSQAISTNLSPDPASFALPTAVGGLAGASLHPLALGNVHTFTKLLAAAPDSALKEIVVIGVGGVVDYEGAERMRRAGAKVVGCATALGREGVDVFRKLSGISKDE